MELQDGINFREYLKQTSSIEGPLRTILSASNWRCVAYENEENDKLKRLEQNKVVQTLVNQVMNPDMSKFIFHLD